MRYTSTHRHLTMKLQHCGSFIAEIWGGNFCLSCFVLLFSPLEIRRYVRFLDVFVLRVQKLSRSKRNSLAFFEKNAKQTCAVTKKWCRGIEYSDDVLSVKIEIQFFKYLLETGSLALASTAIDKHCFDNAHYYEGLHDGTEDNYKQWAQFFRYGLET